MTPRIINITPESLPHYHEQAAAMLVGGFPATPAAWPTIEEAREEVTLALEPEKIFRAAIGDDDSVLGWVGGIPIYDGNAFELHPLIVRADMQRNGIGRALIADLETQVAARGGLTIYLGSDDEIGATSLGGVDLYDNLPARLANVQNLKNHPFTFYQKCGFVIVGVFPDANGVGKPDIFMAKRVVPIQTPTHG